ncbi:MAG TPA: prolyl oligopeptidase family serine peptidase [Urbifossiella sp.]|nr:prolyl oligopeptidase family serine peptidase [Urbifossiella sp.]
MPTRRDWFQFAGLNALAAGPSFSFAQEKKAPALAPLNRFPRAVQEWYVARVREVERASLARQTALKTQADAENYIRGVKAKIARSFGPFPEKTPLNAKSTGTLERDAYRIEKLIFESRPGFLVTANLYIPKGGTGPRPAVVGACGHSTNGKAEPAYQSFCQGLARMGYVALIYDPIGQGERLQYGHLRGKGGPGVGVGEHLLAGNQQFLVGEFLGGWRAWDGIRALDYLLSRPEVDPKHVGITGNSGGGTLTTWLCGVESRWTMAAPACFVTTFRRNLENELPADTEQCPPHALALGLDHADFLACMAPKPLIVLAKERDYFDARGAEEAFRRLQRIYGLFGAEDKVKLHIGPTSHGYSQENREAMYQWFNKATGASDAKAEPKLVLEKDADLQCTPTGQAADLKSRTVFSFTRELARQQAKARKPASGDALKQRLEAALKLPNRTGLPEYRILRPIGNRKYPKPHATAYVLETELPAVAVVYRLSDTVHYARPPKSDSPAILYVSHHSADAELRDEPLIRETIQANPEAAIFACDLRGVGESRPDTCGGPNQFLTPYGNDFFYAIHGLMLDRPYVGQKTFDLLRVLDWIASFGHPKVHFVAKGWGTIPAKFASVLHPLVKQVTLKDDLKSYQEVAESELYKWPLSSFVPDVLKRFDLPELR